MADAHLATPSGKPRARALGIPLAGRPGPSNAITDVPGVTVSFTTLIEGAGIRTGSGPSVVANEEMTGYRGHRVPALPRERVRAAMV